MRTLSTVVSTLSRCSVAVARGGPRRRTLPSSSRSTWYCPRQHVWIRPSLEAHTVRFATAPLTHKLQVGLTSEGWDALGDVTRIEWIRPPSPTKTAGTAAGAARVNDNRGIPSYDEGHDILHLHWEGFCRSEADELYHAVWDNVEGVHRIQCPVSGGVIDAVTDMEAIHPLSQSNISTTDLDEDDVLAEIYCSNDSLQRALPRWMTKAMYQRHVKQHARGKFAESQ